jgi:PAS domain S-box-containing protein
VTESFRPVEILLVDDRRENLLSLRAILDDQPGYRLVEATSGAEALRAILNHDFGLILLDVCLPGMDGFEVAAMIKQRERSKDIPIIFLTAGGLDEETFHRAYQVGAADYLIKPISREMVRAKVAVFVDLARKNAQLREQAARLQEVERKQQATEMAELKMASERRYRHLAESIPHMIWRALPDGQVEYWNQRWYDYTGATQPMSADSGWGYVHPDDRDRCGKHWQEALERGTPYQCEMRLLRSDGVYRWHLRRSLPERGGDGQIIAWLGTDTDIDDRRRADDERAELLVRERAARFEAEAAQKRAARLYVEAREAVRLRDDFLTVAAHELRTPLTTLRLQAQALSRSVGASESARTLLRAVERLCKLADQLLDVSRIAGGRLTLQIERADVPGIVLEAAQRLEEEARRNGCAIAVRTDGELPADCDPLRIEQVVTNLVVNAIKYGRGKPIEVAVARQSRFAQISVRDHGIGVPAEDQERIFERFGRAVSVREYGGLGMGLYISKQIIEAHGGSIRVASEAGEGATFTIEFPLEQRAAEETHVTA